MHPTVLCLSKSLLIVVLLLSFSATHVDAKSCPDDCNNRGFCDENTGKCSCRSGWEGEGCTISFASKIGALWDVYVYIFLSLFVIETIIACWMLYRLLRAEEWDWRPTSMKLTFGFIIGQGVARSLYYAIDPHTQRDLVPAQVDIVLYESGLWPMFLLYGNLLYHRYSIYKRFQREEMSPKLFRAAVITAFVFPLLEYMLALIIWSRRTGTGPLLAYYTFLGICIVGLFSVFFLNGRKLYNMIQEAMFSEEAKIVRKVHLKKLQYLLSTMTILVVLTVIALVVIAVVITVDYHGDQTPHFFMLQHTIFRIIELSYAAAILWSLKEAPTRVRELMSTVELRGRGQTFSV